MLQPAEIEVWHHTTIDGDSLPEKYIPGKDFILCDNNAFLGRVIQFGQALRFRGPARKFAKYHHAALVVTEDGGLLQEIGNGLQPTSTINGQVINGHVSDYNTDFTLIRVNVTDAEASRVIAYANSCIGEKYGWFSILSDAFTIITGAKFFFGYSTAKVCSAFVAKALEHGGQIMNLRGDAISYMPADLAGQYLEWTFAPDGEVIIHEGTS